MIETRQYNDWNARGVVLFNVGDLICHTSEEEIKLGDDFVYNASHNSKDCNNLQIRKCSDVMIDPCVGDQYNRIPWIWCRKIIKIEKL